MGLSSLTARAKASAPMNTNLQGYERVGEDMGIFL
jgi:hypothetical protein